MPGDNENVIEAILRRVTRRCRWHATVSYGYLADLERDLGLPVTEPHPDFMFRFSDHRLLDCGHPWCPVMRDRRRSHPLATK